MDWPRREVGTTFLSVIVNCKVVKEGKHQAALMETRLQSQKENIDGQHLMMLCSSVRPEPGRLGRGRCLTLLSPYPDRTTQVFNLYIYFRLRAKSILDLSSRLP